MSVVKSSTTATAIPTAAATKTDDHTTSDAAAERTEKVNLPVCASIRREKGLKKAERHQILQQAPRFKPQRCKITTS